MADEIDLTLSSDDEAMPKPPPRSKVPTEEEQRKRIMAFAAGVAAKKQKCDPSSQQEGPSGASPSKEQEQAMKPPLNMAIANSRITSPGGSQDGEPGSSAASSGGNSLLAQLHAERIARMRQREGNQVPKVAAGAAASEAAATQHATPAAASDASPGRRMPSRGGAAQQRSPPAGKAAGTLAAEGAAAAAHKAATVGSSAGQPPRPQQQIVTLLQYNVWFNEEAAVEERMAAIGRIIEEANYPTFIALQEVTPYIMTLLMSSDWWGKYTASPAPLGQYFTLMLVNQAQVAGVTPARFRRQAFPNSVMGRCLLSIATSVAGRPLVVATSHLESPCPPHNFYSKERVQQMGEALRVLDAAPTPNVLFAGDLNWDDTRDGSPPLKDGWCDCWVAANPGQPGFTYDTKANKMLLGSWPGARLDRVLAKLTDMRVRRVTVVGKDPIPGVTYTKTFRNGGSRKLPVLPSDHFGLLLELELT